MHSTISPLTILVSLVCLLSTTSDRYLYGTFIYDVISRKDGKDNEYDDILKKFYRHDVQRRGLRRDKEDAYYTGVDFTKGVNLEVKEISKEGV